MNSFITWIGGKKLLRNKIMEQFPEAGSYDRYIEVFGGAGWVLFAKDRQADLEVYNDINGDLVNLFRCVKYHSTELQRELDGLLMSREAFYDAREQIKSRGLTDIQRAARFYQLIHCSFGANQHYFGLQSKDLQKAVGYLAEVSGRLKRVVIENQSYDRLIKTYDRPGALFYLDPPYYAAEGYYTGFEAEDHERLRDILAGIKGRFVLSYNDCPEIREHYRDYTLVAVDRQENLVTKSGSRRYRELIIKNF